MVQLHRGYIITVREKETKKSCNVSCKNREVDKAVHQLFLTEKMVSGPLNLTQPTIKCSKLTIEILEQGVKYHVVLVSLLLTLNIFHTLV